MSNSQTILENNERINAAVELLRTKAAGSSTEVYDGLDSESTTSALSANQGRILKEILDGKLSADDVYPVGSIYLSVAKTVLNSSPASWLGGTWELLPEGYALWTTQQNAYGGTIIGAGLPNIIGTFQGGASANTETSGVFTKETGGNGYGGSGTKFAKYTFDASANGTTLYGRSNTVQPPAYCVFAWKRIA